jgi:hypothetical protein
MTAFTASTCGMTAFGFATSTSFPVRFAPDLLAGAAFADVFFAIGLVAAFLVVTTLVVFFATTFFFGVVFFTVVFFLVVFFFVVAILTSLKISFKFQGSGVRFS